MENIIRLAPLELRPSGYQRSEGILSFLIQIYATELLLELEGVSTTEEAWAKISKHLEDMNHFERLAALSNAGRDVGAEGLLKYVNFSNIFSVALLKYSAGALSPWAIRSVEYCALQVKKKVEDTFDGSKDRGFSKLR